MNAFIQSLKKAMTPEGREAFSIWDRVALINAMRRCSLDGYPPVSPPIHGERASGDALCQCGLKYREHPLDWRLLGYDNKAFLHITCDGRRVKP